MNEHQRVGAELGSCGQMLAAYLLEFPGRIHRRERLAELFWRDLDADRSRAALNTALWRVRKLLTVEHAGHTVTNIYTSGPEVSVRSRPEGRRRYSQLRWCSSKSSWLREWTRVFLER